MARPRRDRGRRGTVVALLALALLLLIADLLRPDSFLLDALRGEAGRPRTPIGRFLDDLTR